MSDGQEGRRAADCREPPCGRAAEPQPRRTALPDDLDVKPDDSLRVPGAERFHGGFLGRKAGREVDGRDAPPHAVRDFVFRKDSTEKPLAVALDHVRDTIDVGSVETGAEDVRHVVSA